jgi:DNA-binding NtrC family response regulator
MSGGAKVLVVDDEPLVRRVCEMVLESNNFRPIIASNGAEALDCYRRSLEEIVLVLSDIGMPIMSGIDMAREMFVIKPHANIILMTGYDAQLVVPGDLKRLCSLINKPFTAGQLIAAVRKCLNYEEERRET